jgi:16S rRNA (guanine527-N7)-methyltransferase
MSTGGIDGEGLAGLRHRVQPELRDALIRSFELGFLGSMPIDDQIDHALGFVAVVEEELGRPPRSVVDLGTGGGVPGLVLASCWPEAHVVLLDASERRTEFLKETVDGWSTVRDTGVVRGRAEELGRVDGLRERFEVVTSRSFGPPPLTAECGSAFLALGGLMVVSEPPDAASEDRWPSEGLAAVGLATQVRARPGGRFGYQVIRKVERISERYPRRVGVPAKRPIF